MYLFEIDNFVIIFTVMSDQFNVSLLNKDIDLFEIKSFIDPFFRLLNKRVS